MFYYPPLPVELFTASHGEVPILIDFTPPVAGQVLDGDRLLQDIDYQHDITRICAQWPKFYDPESGIDSYLWGVGTNRGEDNIVPFRNYTHRAKSDCSDVHLQHNTTYYSTIVALNGALNQKEVEEISDGVLVDITPPLPGYVQDGPSLLSDVDFSSKIATVESSWANFTDPESHVPEYEVTVYVNDDLKKTIVVGSEASLTDHTFSMKHLDYVRVDVTAMNGAGLHTLTSSDGYLIDETPPQLLHISDSEDGEYQSDSSYLKLKWQFNDDESGILEYRYIINQNFGGQKHQFWPVDKRYEVVTTPKQEVHLDSLTLTNGAVYTVSVTAMNKALLSSLVESGGVLIDETIPTLTKVLVALPQEEEEVGEDNNVVHIEGEPLHVSWTARDPESGIAHSLLCVVEDSQSCQDDDFVDHGLETSATLSSSKLIAEQGIKYFVVVRVINGARLLSEKKSKAITVLKGNSPGSIYDGRIQHRDANYQQDLSSLSMSFDGFESEACGITGYDWGIGTEPYNTDIMRYTNYGLTMINENAGFAEISNTNFENTKYFVTVRAITGEDCHEPYIVSSSDGVTADRTNPNIKQFYSEKDFGIDAVYQNQTDSIPISWTIVDASDLASASWSIDTTPFAENKQTIDLMKRNLAPDDVDLSLNNTYFITIFSDDMAGNEGVMISPPIMMDESPVLVEDFTCTEFISRFKTIVHCSWEILREVESRISKIEIVLSENPLVGTQLSVSDRAWSWDMTDIIADTNTTSNIHIVMKLLNTADVQYEVIRNVIIDHTAPESGEAYVVSSGTLQSRDHCLCQEQTSFISVAFDDFIDEDSYVERHEIGLGTKLGLTDVKSYTPVEVHNGVSTLGNLLLTERSLVYVTVRVFNKVGLFTVVDAGSVAVSPEPYLTVLDGPWAEDIDSQHHLSVIQGSWILSDPCPVISAEWAVEDVTGSKVKDFEHTPGDGQQFYDDELTLENMKTYIVSVKVIDAINRTISGRSDSVIVRIQPPVPGHVRDGLGKDINYQLPTDYLAANWDSFGNPDSDSVSQRIEHYEVAIGDDNRYDETRSNIHFYEHVGLNTTHVFQHLNLTSKSQRYYIAVRAYTVAGSFEESFSNGIRVGYGDDILPGELSVEPYQSSTSQMSASWTPFVSDFDIREYYVAIHTDFDDIMNGSIQCLDLDFSPIVPFKSVGLNTIAEIENLHLNHSQVYYVIVKAEDEAGICLMVVSEAVTVDTTPPQAGDVSIEGGKSGDMMYAWDPNTLHVHLLGFEDSESHIKKYTVNLLDTDCSGDHVLNVMKTIDTKEPDIYFYDINLDSDRVYYINASVQNKAGLTTEITSHAIITDMSPPSPGVVSFGSDWKNSASSWNNVNELEGTIALNSQPGEHSCLSQREILFGKEIQILENGFEPEAVEMSSEAVTIFGRLDPSLTLFHRGAITIQSSTLQGGKYSFSLRLTADVHVASVVGIMNGDVPRPENILEAMNRNFIDNCTDTECSKASVPSQDGGWNIGILFTLHEETSAPILALWASDRESLKVHRIDLEFDPRETLADFTFSFRNTSTRSSSEWSVDFSINDILKGGHSGLDVSGSMSLFGFVWNIDDFQPVVNDPFDPYSRHLILSSVKIPVEKPELCHFGKLFSDRESGIKYIYIGLSDSQNETANIAPYTKEKSFCIPCNSKCILNCTFNFSCAETDHSDSFLFDFSITNLNLTPSSMPDKVNYTDTFISSYYFDVKVTDHAGHSTEVKSDGIVIDTTPPEVTVCCYDPEYSLFDSVIFLGNDHKIAASWQTSEDFSDVASVFVAVGTACGAGDVLKPSYQELTTNVTLVFSNHTFVQNRTYFISVSAINSAGLESSQCCNLTADFRKPSLPLSEPEVLYTTSETVPGLDVGISNHSDKLGIQWESPISDVEYFSWSIISEDSQSDIYPPLRVGDNSSRHAEIIKGDIYTDNKAVFTSMSEYLNRNFSDGMTSDDFSNGPLSLEPGKCVAQVISGISRANKKTKLSSKKVCFKRKNDILVTRGETAQLEFKSGEIHEGDTTSDINHSSLAITVSAGAVTVGALSEEDTRKPYGAPAAASYLPFIVAHDMTFDRVSRYLRKRLVRFVGGSVFLAPVTDVHLKEDASLTLSRSDFATIENNTEPAVLFWDAVDSIWRHVFEVCGVNSRPETRYFKICNTVFVRSSDSRAKRSAPVSSSPRMFSGATVRSLVHNTAPVITTETIHCLEDMGLLVQIEYHDSEGDSLNFTLETDGDHGTTNITSDGKLFYRPEKDFYGSDSVVIVATEHVSSTISVQPHIVRKLIHLNVSNVNDQPVSFFQYGEGQPVPSFVQSTHTIFLEGNQTEHEVGSFWIADVDHEDTLKILRKDTIYKDFNFFLRESSERDLYNLSSLYSETTLSKHVFNIVTSEDFHGKVDCSIRVKDLSNSYSHPLTVEVYVLINPCQHGGCSPTTDSLPCNHPTRSLTFDPYRCECEVGYEGEFCQQEINECFQATCSLLYDCEDRLAAYECVLNTPKIIAIFMCILLAGGGLGLILFRLYKKKIKSYKIGLLVETADEIPPNPILELDHFSDNVTESSSESDEDIPEHNVESVAAQVDEATSTSPTSDDEISEHILEPEIAEDNNISTQSTSDEEIPEHISEPEIVHEDDNILSESTSDEEIPEHILDNISRTVTPSCIELSDMGVRPGTLNMPHRRGTQRTSGIKPKDKSLPEVMI